MQCPQAVRTIIVVVSGAVKFTSITSNPGSDDVQVKLCSDTGCLHDACGQRAHYPCSVHRSGFSLSEPSLSLSFSSASEAAAAAFKGICHADAGFTQTCLQKACCRRTHKLCSVHLAVRTIIVLNAVGNHRKLNTKGCSMPMKILPRLGGLEEEYG